MALHPNFKLVGIEPGIVITFQFGAVDFRNPVPLSVLETLYQSGFPYLQLSKQGEKAYAPIIADSSVITLLLKEAVTPNPQTLNPKKKSRARKSK